MGLAASAVINTQTAGLEGQRRNSEAESFGRIMRALSRSVSPDAVVEAIVHELGAATGADHVAVARWRPGGTVVDVTFVSMLPGTAATSNTVMPLRQLEQTETGRGRARPRLAPDDRNRAAESGAGMGEASTAFRRDVGPRFEAARALDDETRARQMADRIASRLGESYGLRNTLAAPLLTGRSVAGAIVLWTQVPNRRYFDEYCRLLVSSRRATDRVAILSIDVDHFKKINDRYGHQVGDVALCAIARSIQVSVREADVPCVSAAKSSSFCSVTPRKASPWRSASESARPCASWISSTWASRNGSRSRLEWLPDRTQARTSTRSWSEPTGLSTPPNGPDATGSWRPATP
jgi:GAF domain-containing protein